jgi:hypothetical protein
MDGCVKITTVRLENLYKNFLGEAEEEYTEEDEVWQTVRLENWGRVEKYI